MEIRDSAIKRWEGEQEGVGSSRRKRRSITLIVHTLGLKEWVIYIPFLVLGVAVGGSPKGMGAALVASLV